MSDTRKPQKLTKGASRIPKQWLPWYDKVIEYRIKGTTMAEISKILSVHPNTISRICNMPQFIVKMEEIRLIQSDTREIIDGIAELNAKKHALIQEMIRIAMTSESDNTRVSALIWLLERFPEFATKAAMAQQTNIVQITKEDSERQEAAASKLEELMNLMKSGKNPYVISKDTNPTPIANDNTGQDTYTS